MWRGRIPRSHRTMSSRSATSDALADLEAERARLAEREQALLEVTQTLASSLDEWSTLELAVRAAAGLLQAPYARIWLVEEHGDLGRSVTCGDKVAETRRDHLPSASVTGSVVKTGQPVVLTDVVRHPAWRDQAFVDCSGLRAYLG